MDDALRIAKMVKPVARVRLAPGGNANNQPTIGSILQRGQPMQPTTPSPTPQEMAAARADTRTSAQHVNQRLNTIVPEADRVVGGTYTAGAPNGGRWADLPQQFLNSPGVGFKVTPQIRQADALHKNALADLEANPNSGFHKAAVEQTGKALEQAHKGGDAVLQHIWEQAVNESSQAAKNAVAQHNIKPTFGSHDWDKSMSLPLRDHLWYELSGEKMAENVQNITPSEYLKGMDLVGATSARAEPGENLERALGVLSQHLRGVPTDVDLTIPSTVRQALSRSHSGGSSALPGNKTGHFSDTLALTGGVPTRFPISVNDVWVGKMFGVPDDVMSSNQSLHEPMALYFNKIRDLYNKEHGHELPFKYQSWNFQAPAWVHLRNEPSGDAYHQVWGGIINKLKNAGVPGIQGDKITRQALMHPKFADALRRTTEGFRSAPKATVEFGTTQTPTGAQAAELYRHAVENGDQTSQDQYLKGLTTAMFQSSRGKHPWDMLKKAVTGDLTGASDITRISTPTSDSPFDSGGTFEGAVSPNIRVPLKGMNDEQIAMMHAIAGHHLKQDAMATSTVHMANPNEEPREDHVRGHSLFVPTTDPIHPDHIRGLAKALSARGHDMSFTRHPNGYMFDTIPRFDDEGAHGIDHDTLRQAANQSLGNLYPTGKIMAHDFKSVYNPSSEYADYKSKLLKRMHDDFTRESFDQEPSENNARKAIVGPKGPNPPSGRSKKAWNTYTQRLNYLAAAEEGFKSLASRVNDSHSKFIDDAHKRMERAGSPFVGPLRNITSEHDARGGFIRRAYKKGGKVEGSIWHARDAFDEGGDVRAGDSVGGLGGDTGGFSEHDVGEAQGAVNEATAAAQEARQGMQSMDEAFGPARSGPETSAFNSGNGEPPPVVANIMPRSTTPGGILAGSQPPTPESSDYSIVNAFSAPKQMPIGITGIGMPSSGINMSQTPAQMEAAVSAEAGAPVGDPNNPASYFGGQPAQVASATGTPAGSILAMQPQHYEPMGNKIPDLTGVTASAGNVQTAALPAPTVQPMAPHTLTPDTARTDLTGVTAPAGNVQMSALPAPNVQPNAPHSLTPNAASTPQPSVSSAYTETQPSIADQANAAIPTPMNGVPTPPIPLRDLQGPSIAEGIAGLFGLSTQQQFDKFYNGYIGQGNNETDAYNKAIGDIQTMRANAQPGPFDRSGKTQKIQKLMPDGTYQWVDAPYKRGGGVHSSQIVDHVLAKFGAPLPASNNPYYGNKAGRR